MKIGWPVFCDPKTVGFYAGIGKGLFAKQFSTWGMVSHHQEAHRPSIQKNDSHGWYTAWSSYLFWESCSPEHLIIFRSLKMWKANRVSAWLKVLKQLHELRCPTGFLIKIIKKGKTIFLFISYFYLLLILTFPEEEATAAFRRLALNRTLTKQNQA